MSWTWISGCHQQYVIFLWECIGFGSPTAVAFASAAHLKLPVPQFLNDGYPKIVYMSSVYIYIYHTSRITKYAYVIFFQSLFMSYMPICNEYLIELTRLWLLRAAKKKRAQDAWMMLLMIEVLKEQRYDLLRRGVETFYGKVSWRAPQKEYLLNNDSFLVNGMEAHFLLWNKNKISNSVPQGQELNSDMIGIYVYPHMDYVYIYI